MSDAEATGGTGTGPRGIELERESLGRYRVRNPRGGELVLGAGEDADFTPVELLLAAIAGCSSVDVDHLTSRLAQPSRFVVTSQGTKVRDEDGNHLSDIDVVFDVTFAAGKEGDMARDRLPVAIAKSHERLCTVSRTVERGTPITMAAGTIDASSTTD